MIDDPAKARAHAEKILRGIRLLVGDLGLAADSPALVKGRQAFRSKVTPALHGIFEETLASLPPGDPVSPATRRRIDRWLVAGTVGIALLLLGGSMWLSHQYGVIPGKAANAEVLEAWIAGARSGRTVRPTSPGDTTDAVLRAVASSNGHRVTGDHGGYGLSGTGTTCFEVDLHGPGTVTPVAIRITDDPAPLHVTHAGLRPPCECGRSGRVTACAP